MEKEYSILECAVCHEPIGMKEEAYIWEDPDNEKNGLIAHRRCVVQTLTNVFAKYCGAIAFIPEDLDNADDFRLKPKTEKEKTDEYFKKLLGI